MIKLTVALPLFNANQIAWLALESLCNQKNIDFNWELIICEEDNQNRTTDLIDYVDRLKDVKCVKITYLPIAHKILLAKKWQVIGNAANANSKVFVLQAGDCYSSPNRLSQAYQKIAEEDFDWIDTTQGLFYSFISRKLFKYSSNALTNLDMSFKTEYARNIPETTLTSGIDRFLFKNCEKKKADYLKIFHNTKLHINRLDTHGCNNISIHRETYFKSKPHIFKNVGYNLSKLDLPKPVISKLLKIVV